MAKNFYTVQETINGTTYIAQYSGISTALRALDETYIDGTGNNSMIKMAEYLFENVIVEPKGLTIDDFDSMDEFNKVVSFARKVMQGEFRNKENEGAAKAASKK